jgi:hypothetical protein
MIIKLDIPFELEPGQVIKRLRIPAGSIEIEKMVTSLVENALQVAKPKGVYRIDYVENRDGDSLEIGGVKFTSHVLRKNLNRVERVFPYVVTCGRELEELKLDSADFLQAFCLDMIKEMAVASALNFLSGYLKKRYLIEKGSHMNPGSLPDWPITQQKQLFSLFADVETLIGVNLMTTCLMYPLKSLSGIYFPTKVSFESCQLCQRAKCPGRRSAYSPQLVAEYTAKYKS